MRNHLKRGGGEVTALDMIMTVRVSITNKNRLCVRQELIVVQEIFNGNPPRELYKYFRNRRRHFAFNPFYLQNQKYVGTCPFPSHFSFAFFSFSLDPKIGIT